MELLTGIALVLGYAVALTGVLLLIAWISGAGEGG
jgi:hypothetical protein